MMPAWCEGVAWYRGLYGGPPICQLTGCHVGRTQQRTKHDQRNLRSATPLTPLPCPGLHLCCAQRPLASWDDTHAQDVTQVAFHPANHATLVSASEDGLIAIFDTAQMGAQRLLLLAASAVHLVVLLLLAAGVALRLLLLDVLLLCRCWLCCCCGCCCWAAKQVRGGGAAVWC